MFFVFYDYFWCPDNFFSKSFCPYLTFAHVAIMATFGQTRIGMDKKLGLAQSVFIDQFINLRNFAVYLVLVKILRQSYV